MDSACRSPEQDAITALHTQRNTTTRGCWKQYAPHRARVAQLLMEQARGSAGRLCVLGAGNCNDLDLSRLAAGFGEVHLVDLDGDALRRGVERQQMTQHSGILLHPAVDVTAMGAYLARCARGAAAPPDVQQAVPHARAAAVPLPGAPFDCLASVGLLTQVIDSVAVAVPPRRAAFAPLVLALRDRHLRLLLEGTCPGGRAVLITDLVSSVTAPGLADWPETELARRVAALIEQRNFFTGVNPAVLHALLQNDPALALWTASVRMVGPWRWSVLDKVYAVCGLVITRNDQPYRVK